MRRPALRDLNLLDFPRSFLSLFRGIGLPRHPNEESNDSAIPRFWLGVDLPAIRGYHTPELTRGRFIAFTIQVVGSEVVVCLVALSNRISAL